MLSTIYQISTKPIQEDDLLDRDLISEGDEVNISYIKKPCDVRSKYVAYLVNKVLPEGMFHATDDNTLIYNGGYENWLETQCQKIKALSYYLNPANPKDCKYTFYSLRRALVNPLETSDLFVTFFHDGVGVAERSSEIMNIIRDLKKGDKLYIGSIFTYHD